jgi:uncharacterized protein YodC (DUF2158 family)
MTFQVGDVVQLRYGGGPHIRVEKAVTSDDNEWVTCVWGANNECHNYFAAEMLQRVEAKGEPPITGEDIDRFRIRAQQCRAVVPFGACSCPTSRDSGTSRPSAFQQVERFQGASQHAMTAAAASPSATSSISRSPRPHCVRGRRVSPARWWRSAQRKAKGRRRAQARSDSAPTRSLPKQRSSAEFPHNERVRCPCRDDSGPGALSSGAPSFSQGMFWNALPRGSTFQPP